MTTKSRTDALIATLAGRAHGVVTRRGLLAAGISSDEIRHRVRRGTLICVHRGVFRVGHAAASLDATYLAAVLACGDQALLADGAAAHLHRLTRKPPLFLDVVAPMERRVDGIRTRRTRTGVEGTIVRHIPVTTVPRTLVDRAAQLDAGALARLCHEAGVVHGTTPRHVQAILDRHPKSPGIRKLRAVMLGDEKVTLSRLERGFVALLRGESLPLPATNRVASGRRVDCRWPEHHLTIELDSFTFHNSLHSWKQDRLREREAYARGDQLRRYAWSDVFDDPRAMLTELRGLLS